jgi:hypothetical protein
LLLRKEGTTAVLQTRIFKQVPVRANSLVAGVLLFPMSGYAAAGRRQPAAAAPSDAQHAAVERWQKEREIRMLAARRRSEQKKREEAVSAKASRDREVKLEARAAQNQQQSKNLKAHLRQKAAKGKPEVGVVVLAPSKAAPAASARRQPQPKPQAQAPHSQAPHSQAPHSQAPHSQQPHSQQPGGGADDARLRWQQQMRNEQNRKKLWQDTQAAMKSEGGRKRHGQQRGEVLDR